jgi:gliding motility-associated-like protein
MFNPTKHISTITIACLLAMGAAKGQATACPPNIDFEAGDLAGWQCYTGNVESIAGVNTITWTGNQRRPDNHNVYSNDTPELDLFGRFPVTCPNGSGFSLKLGNNYLSTISAEGVYYTYRIPDTATLFYYAVVFQDPQHTPDEQPRFRARVYNITDSEVIDCSNFDFTASASLPGFRVSTVDTTVIYKDWTPVTLNLSGYAGKTIRLEFITSDCTYTGHFGYAYIDINSSCSGAVTGNVICPGDNAISVTAPHGFQSYTWYADASYSTVLSNNQTLVLSPPPAPGSIFPVIVGPYPGFGCPDTLMAELQSAGLPVANAGPDAEFCYGLQAHLGTTAIPGYAYSWSPDTLVVSKATSITLTVPGLDRTVDLYLMVRDNSTGCMNYDTVQAKPVMIDTAMVVTGDSVFCNPEKVNTVLHALAANGNIQWYENGNAVPGATSPVFNPRPVSPDNIYYATITSNDCIKWTRETGIHILPGPVADFVIDPPEQCVNGPVTMRNKTTLQTGSITSYAWELSDGRTFTTEHISVAFAAPGSYDIALKTFSAGGCADSTSKTVNVIRKCDIYVPLAFTPGQDGKNDLFRPVIYGHIKLGRFSVYDRSGFMVYSTSTPGEGWDGRFRGRLPTSSVFVWMLEYFTAEGKKMLLKGTVTVIR